MAEGILHKFASNPGALVPTVLIAATQVASNNEAFITDFGATANSASSNSVFQLQKSTDGFVLNVEELDRIEMPTGGTVLKTFGRPIEIRPTESFRVIFTQGVAGTVSATLNGDTSNGNIED